MFSRSADQCRNIALCQPNCNEGLTLLSSLPVLFGEDKQLAGNSTFDRLCGEGLNFLVGMTQPRRQYSGEIECQHRHRNQTTLKIRTVNPQERRSFDCDDACRSLDVTE